MLNFSIKQHKNTAELHSNLKNCYMGLGQVARYQTALGFTLIELLIVVAIIGILSAISIPSYQNYLTRGKIPEATSQLSTIRAQMEQFFQDNHKYTGATVCGTLPAGQNFDFACDTVTDTTYILKATGKAGTAMDGFTYKINEQNARSTQIVAPANSAFIGNNDNCWILRPGGSCN